MHVSIKKKRILSDWTRRKKNATRLSKQENVVLVRQVEVGFRLDSHRTQGLKPLLYLCALCIFVWKMHDAYEMFRAGGSLASSTVSAHGLVCNTGILENPPQQTVPRAYVKPGLTISGTQEGRHCRSLKAPSSKCQAESRNS